MTEVEDQMRGVVGGGQLPMSLNDGWEDLVRLVFHDGIPESQRIEMRRAFYAGAATVLGVVNLQPDRIEALRVECREFGVKVGKVEGY